MDLHKIVGETCRGSPSAKGIVRKAFSGAGATVALISSCRSTSRSPTSTHMINSFISSRATSVSTSATRASSSVLEACCKFRQTSCMGGGGR